MVTGLGMGLGIHAQASTGLGVHAQASTGLGILEHIHAQATLRKENGQVVRR